VNWDQVEGKWKQIRGAVKEKWGKLTDDDLDQIAGKRDQFIGKLQQRYGIATEEAQRQADQWLRAQDFPSTEPVKHREAGRSGLGNE
jgi:uncharacterized protein YjbJ (UPF0337 family)